MRVYAIDVLGSEYLAHTRFPTIRYDGSTIPFADAAFDVIYSSNVLEHVAHVETFQREIIRVLRPGGRIIHVLPTPAWRLATTLTHYAYIMRYLMSMVRQKIQSPKAPGALNPSLHHPPRKSLLRAVIPARHGEFGNFISEMYYFSKARWISLFKRAGLTVEATSSLGLFYTGYCVMDAALSIPARRRLSSVLGSACRLYVLRPASKTT
jgi:SAM-dependent methyltransferase